MTTEMPGTPDEPTGAVPPYPPPAHEAPKAADPPPAPQGAYPPPPAPGYVPPQGAYPPQYAVQPPLSDSDQRMWSVLAHVGGILFSFVAPLVVWLIFRGRGAFVENQAKEALNFQITVAIAYLIGTILLIIIIGGLVMLAAGVCSLVFGILAAVACNRGELYRYPVTLRLVK